MSTAPRCSDSVNRERQLQLAVAWNRLDIAESEIFTEESKWKVWWIFIPSTNEIPTLIGQKILINVL